MISYSRQWILDDDIRETIKTLRGDWITQGPKIQEFESAVARYVNVPHALAVNSGTAALQAAVFCAGIEEGDEVIVTPFSFVASANCIVYQKATPVFADIDYRTGLINPREVEKKITSKTKAVITVDYGGHPSYFDELRVICRRHNLVLIDDACHSLGAMYKGERVGSQADITVFSFHPVKSITTGEGGLMATNNKKMFERAFLFRTHGITKNPKTFLQSEYRTSPWYYEMQILGYNFRITDFQCALGISQLKKIGNFLSRRKKIAYYYHEAFGGDPRFVLPIEQEDMQSSWHLYPIRIKGISRKKKEKLFKEFSKKGILPQVHYIPIHIQPFYQKNFGYRLEDFPYAEKFYEEEVSLPLYPTLQKKQAGQVVKILKEYA